MSQARLGGSGGDYTVSLPNATAVEIPESANRVGGPYVLELINGSGVTVYHRWTTGTANGMDLLDGDKKILVLEAGETVFVYQSSGGAVNLDYGVKEIKIT